MMPEQSEGGELLAPVTRFSEPDRIAAWLQSLHNRTGLPRYLNAHVERAIVRATEMLEFARSLEPAELAPVQYPPLFAEAIQRELATSHGTEALPSAELHHLCDECFKASITLDEGREAFFRVLLADPTRLPVRGGQAQEEFIRFEKPLNLSSSALVKLSQALGYWDEIVVCRFRIWGIQRAEPAWSHLIRNLGMHAAASPFGAVDSRPPVTITNHGAGHLHAASERSPLAVLNNGVVFLPPRSPCPALEIFDGAERELQLHLEQAAEIKCSQLILDVLRRIARRRHGGSILVVPDDVVEAVPQTASKYTVKWTALWDRLLTVSANAAQLARLSVTPLDGSNPTSPELHRPNNSVHLRELSAKFEQSVDAVEHEIRFLAGLSAVDGAILLTDKFKVIGFGTELIVGDSPIGDATILDHDAMGGTKSRAMDESGMRHRSMYKYITAHPATTGFVVSQDGGIRGVHALDGQVHVWTDLASR